MDEGQSEVNPQQPEDADQPDKVVDFQKFKGSQEKVPQDSPQKEDVVDEEAKERLAKVRELTKLAKSIQSQEANREFTPEQKELLRKLQDEYGRENNTVPLDEWIKNNFTPDQVEELKALQEVYDLENTWQHGDEVLAIRNELYDDATSGNERFEARHLPTGSEIVGSVKPWEGEGEIVIIAYKDEVKGKPGSVQIVYGVKAKDGNTINNGNINEKRVTVTIRNPRGKDQNGGRLYILSKETDSETGEERFRQFDSENVKPLKESDMDQEEAMTTLKQVVDAYKDSIWQDEKGEEVTSTHSEEDKDNITQFPTMVEEDQEERPAA